METTRVGIIYTADTLETMFFFGVMAAQNKRKALFFCLSGSNQDGVAPAMFYAALKHRRKWTERQLERKNSS